MPVAIIPRFADGPHCDFCGDTDPVRRIECRPYWMDTNGPLPQHNAGDWAACGTCASLIDRGDREALERRCIDALLRFAAEAMPNLAPGTVTRQVRSIHAGFWKHRIVPGGEG
jgi:hypothetical protein